MCLRELAEEGLATVGYLRDNAPFPLEIQVMKPLLFLLRIPVTLAFAAGVATLSFAAWFFPWIFTLHMGFLIYFPYEPDGLSRYARSTGPLTAGWSDEWVASESIPGDCKKALVASEDAKFFYHNGLDLESIEESYRANERGGRIARGGSTITQQLVKNAFLSRDKSYLRKVREVAGSLMLDATLSKDSQLAWYLNVVEFGPRLYGIQKAARHYFGKDAGRLSRSECAQLVAVLPSPGRWNASLVKKRATPFFTRRTATILARMDQVSLGGDETVRKQIAKERSQKPIAERARKAAGQLDPGREPDHEPEGAPSDIFSDLDAALPAPGEEEAQDTDLPAETPLLPQELLPDPPSLAPAEPAEEEEGPQKPLQDDDADDSSPP